MVVFYMDLAGALAIWRPHSAGAVDSKCFGSFDVASSQWLGFHMATGFQVDEKRS